MVPAVAAVVVVAAPVAAAPLPADPVPVVAPAVSASAAILMGTPANIITPTIARAIILFIVFFPFL
jgi:hypothetical protein